MNVRRSRSTTRSTNFDSARPNKSLSVNIHLRGQQDHTLAVVEDLGVSFVVDTPTRRIGDTAPRQFDADYKSAKRPASPRASRSRSLSTSRCGRPRGAETTPSIRNGGLTSSGGCTAAMLTCRTAQTRTDTRRERTAEASSACIDESALHRPIGSSRIMTAQLDDLAAATSRATIQVITMSAPASVLAPAFTLLTFTNPKDPAVACTTGTAGHVIITTRKPDLHPPLTVAADLESLRRQIRTSASVVNGPRRRRVRFAGARGSGRFWWWRRGRPRAGSRGAR